MLQLQLPGTDPVMLTELLQSVLATASYVPLPPDTGSTKSFAQKRPIVFRLLAMEVVKASRRYMKAPDIYEMVRRKVAPFNLKLSQNPLELEAA